MAYQGRDSLKDIAARLEVAEPAIDDAKQAVAIIQQEVASIPTPEDYDPGDLTLIFKNKLI